MNDEQVIRAGVRSLCNRKLSAMDSFIAYVCEQIGCTQEQAAHVLNVYRKERLIKFDAYMGTWHIKHGAFLDAEVLRRAIAI